MDKASERFEVGDQVTWNSEAGHISGTIVRVHTKDVEYKCHIHHTSPQAPQCEIKSSKTNHITMHKPEALQRSRF